MLVNEIGHIRATVRHAPPPWAVLSVKCCVVGILTFPLVVPLVLAGSAAAGVDESFGRAVFFGGIAVWGAMVILAQYLTTIYPPVSRR